MPAIGFVTRSESGSFKGQLKTLTPMTRSARSTLLRVRSYARQASSAKTP